MAGFLKQKRKARQWANTNGYSNTSGDFDSAYNTALQQVRATGLHGMKARQEALFNAMQNMKSKSEEAWENPEENVGQDTAYAALQKRYNLGSTPVGSRGNDENLDALLSLHGINSPVQRNTPAAAQPAQIQESQQAQAPTGETIKVTSPAQTPVQPATVGSTQSTDVVVETPAPGQPAQIQSTPAVTEEPVAPVQEKYKGQKDYDNLTFGQAFRQAMKDMGEGKVFMYKGKPFKLAYASAANTPQTKPATAAVATDTTVVPSTKSVTDTTARAVTTTADSTNVAQHADLAKPTQIVTSQNSEPDAQKALQAELRQIDSQTWYNQNARRQAINRAHAKYAASRN